MRHCAVCISLFLASMLFFSLVPLSAQDPVVVHPVPVDSLFPEPLADQRFPRFALSFPALLTHAIDTMESDGYGGIREALEFGGVKSLVRLSPGSDDGLGIELVLGAGIFTLFDAFEDDLDNFGWEGSGFLALQYKPTYRFAAKFGLHHLSSHVGDEYLANYGVIDAPIADDGELADGDVRVLLCSRLVAVGVVLSAFTPGPHIWGGTVFDAHARIHVLLQRFPMAGRRWSRGDPQAKQCVSGGGIS